MSVWSVAILVAFVFSTAVCQPTHDSSEAKEPQLLYDTSALRDVIIQLQSEVERLKTAMSDPSSYAQSSGAVTYVRWVRTVCENNAQVLYSGHAAASDHSHQGGGSDFLCLPETPEWRSSSESDVMEKWTGKLFGIEYEGTRLFSEANNAGRALYERPAPCAVCYVTGREATVMIPARMSCPTGWTKEYGGIMVSQASNQEGYSKTSYICWDEAPETRSDGANSQNQAVMYTVQVGCGSLPCSTYPDGWQLSCVVCSK